jgi:hypothetical protein
MQFEVKVMMMMIESTQYKFISCNDICNLNHILAPQKVSFDRKV